MKVKTIDTISTGILAFILAMFGGALFILIQFLGQYIPHLEQFMLFIGCVVIMFPFGVRMVKNFTTKMMKLLVAKKIKMIHDSGQMEDFKEFMKEKGLEIILEKKKNEK